MYKDNAKKNIGEDYNKYVCVCVGDEEVTFAGLFLVNGDYK